jgi:hypothetical protein
MSYYSTNINNNFLSYEKLCVNLGKHLAQAFY